MRSSYTVHDSAGLSNSRNVLHINSSQMRCGAEDIKPVAGAAAAGLACAEVLSHLYQNPNDQAAIQFHSQIFHKVILTRFGNTIPFMNGGDPWPMIVADAILADRSKDGAGNPDSVLLLLFALDCD
jgi:hypothetical protein